MNLTEALAQADRLGSIRLTREEWDELGREGRERWDAAHPGSDLLPDYAPPPFPWPEEPTPGCLLYGVPVEIVEDK